MKRVRKKHRSLFTEALIHQYYRSDFIYDMSHHMIYSTYRRKGRPAVVVSPRACVCVSMLYYTAVSLVSVSSLIISKRFRCGSRRFETSGSQASKASDLQSFSYVSFCDASAMVTPFTREQDRRHSPPAMKLRMKYDRLHSLEPDRSREVTDLLERETTV